MPNNQYSSLFRLALKCLKYFAWILFGLAIAYTLTIGLGMLHLTPILTYLWQNLFVPIGLILLCLMTTAIIVESWR